MFPGGQDKQSRILEFIDALRGREWRALRRLLLCLFAPGVPILFQNRSIFGAYQPYVWCAVGLLFIMLLTSEVVSRPRFSAEPPPKSGYTRTIRGLVFGEDDEKEFATLRRHNDIATVTEALLDPQFRFGVLFAESGCGKTSLLRAGVQPQLTKLGYRFLPQRS